MKFTRNVKSHGLNPDLLIFASFFVIYLLKIYIVKMQHEKGEKISNEINIDTIICHLFLSKILLTKNKIIFEM